MKTNELTETALDGAVAKIEGTTSDTGINGKPWEIPYSNQWAVGGPIIEREKIGIECDDQGIWFASYDLSADIAFGATGITPLIAAMRCYVASKLGDEIDVPKEK